MKKYKVIKTNGNYYSFEKEFSNLDEAVKEFISLIDETEKNYEYMSIVADKHKVTDENDLIFKKSFHVEIIQLDENGEIKEWGFKPKGIEKVEYKLQGDFYSKDYYDHK